ncbi:TraR/DksA family transcriptional regulator [Cellulomonas iranensis]|uniref:TraR/DksA family transcriptional regulator n=1 Tax=Cellulomonas iranensis TaxID=76862 RepID=UPI003D7DA303
MSTNDALSTLTTGSQKGRAALVAVLPVRDGEDPWTDGELAEVATELTADRERLTAELAEADAELSELLRNSGDGAGDDQADSGSSALEREHELTLVNNTRDLLEQTTHALDRLAAGTFGVCESCGQAVGKARLQAFPRAVLCVACKQREERR